VSLFVKNLTEYSDQRTRGSNTG